MLLKTAVLTSELALTVTMTSFVFADDLKLQVVDEHPHALHECDRDQLMTQYIPEVMIILS